MRHYWITHYKIDGKETVAITLTKNMNVEKRHKDIVTDSKQKKIDENHTHILNGIINSKIATITSFINNKPVNYWSGSFCLYTPGLSNCPLFCPPSLSPLFSPTFILALLPRNLSFALFSFCPDFWVWRISHRTESQIRASRIDFLGSLKKSPWIGFENGSKKGYLELNQDKLLPLLF